jgi:hypothetical protein
MPKRSEEGQAHENDDERCAANHDGVHLNRRPLRLRPNRAVHAAKCEGAEKAWECVVGWAGRP